MKRNLFCILLLTVAVVLSANAQQPAPAVVDRPAEPNFVFDDDGGAVQIVPPDFAVAGEKKFHGGAVMASAQQSVFFWVPDGETSKSVRAKPSWLMWPPIMAALWLRCKSTASKTLRASPRLEDFGDLSKTRVNDLTIQQKLSDLLQSKAIPAPTASTVYVIYLAPEIISTLGAHKAGVDYLAYHNFVNLEAGEVHYVVVPFNDNADHHSHAAARAFAEAALSPNGKGWY